MNHWYFGNKAGMNFSDGRPVADSSGKLSTAEGCAAISDESGNLLFYTDGVSVWNSRHQLMLYGTELHGDQSSTNSAVIVPMPGDNEKYYIFTLDKEAGSKGLSYSIVDVGAASGRGKVDPKNIHIESNLTEKLAVARHCNGNDYWIVTHEWESNRFLAYRLTRSGLIRRPVVSQVGMNHAGSKSNLFGYMRFTIDQSRLAVAIFGASVIQVFNFDNSTGQIYAPVSIEYRGEYNFTPYGLEFSPSGRYLFANSLSGFERLLVFDLWAGSGPDIVRERRYLSDRSGGALQLGPDGNIYVSWNSENYAGVIRYPDRGKFCDYDEWGVDLGSGECTFGLPYFIAPFFEDLYVTTNGRHCVGQPVELIAHTSCSFTDAEYRWRRSDGATYEGDTLRIDRVHASDEGIYSLSVTTGGYTLRRNICFEVDVPPQADIFRDGPDLLCEGDSLILSAVNEDENVVINWSTGETTDSIIVRESGTFSLTLDSPNGCPATAMTQVVFSTAPEASITAEDSSFCEGGYVVLSASNYDPENQYYWSNGASGESATFDYPGEHNLRVVNPAGCESEAFIDIIENTLPSPEITATKTGLCPGEMATISLDKKYALMEWSNGKLTQEITISEPGEYSVYIETAEGCSGAANITIDARSTETVNLVESIDFGWLQIGQNAEDEYRIRNKSSEILSINNIYLKHGDQFFEIDPMPDLPVGIAQDGIFIANIGFSPQQNGAFHDSLVLEFDMPCPGRTSIPLFGNSKGFARIFTHDASGMAGEMTSVRISGKLNWDTDLAIESGYSATISFNANSIWPESLPNYRRGERQYFEISGNTEFTSEPVELGEIRFRLMLADSLRTEIRIDEVDLTSERILPITEGAILHQKETCAHEIRVVNSRLAPTASISPMPADEYINIGLSGFSEKIEIKLINITGRTLRTEFADSKSEAIRIESGSLPAGSYSLVIQSGTEIMTLAVLILH